MENVKSQSSSASSGIPRDGTTNCATERAEGSLQLSADERKRHEAFLAFVRTKEQSWAAMSPAERAAAEAMWEAAAKNINHARAGHRKVFVG